MFDANAAYIKIGEKFFAEVHEVDQQLVAAGVKVGDIILCEHVEKTDNRPVENAKSKFWRSLDSEPIEWLGDGDPDWSWMKYSGRPNGQGFICERWKAKALEFMGGSWDAR